MNRLRLITAVVLLACLAACPPFSLQPLFVGRDLIFDPALVGVWKDAEEGKAVCTFKRLDAGSYEVTFTEGKETAIYRAELGKLGSHRFLDVSPKSDSPEPHYLSVHSFWRLRIDADSMEITGLEGDYLRPLIDAKKIGIAQKVQGTEVFTGSTAELQDFLIRNSENPALFRNTTRYRRVR